MSPLTFDSVEPEPRRKVEFKPDAATNRSPRRSRVIVSVTEPGYVPAGFEVAVRIDSTMFTALASAPAIAATETDHRVASVARSRRV